MSSPAQSPDDAVLVARFCRGEADAFEDLYRRHAQRIVTLAERITGRPAVAEEIAQETFLRAAQSFCSAAHGSFAGWLFTVAKRLSLDELRRRRRRDAVPLDAVPEIELFGLVDPWSPHSDMNLAVRLLDDLPAHYRRALLLKEVAGLQAQEIAEDMDLSVASVEKIVSRARGRLRSEYARASG